MVDETFISRNRSLPFITNWSLELDQYLPISIDMDSESIPTWFSALRFWLSRDIVRFLPLYVMD